MALSGRVYVNSSQIPHRVDPEYSWAPSVRNMLRVHPGAIRRAAQMSRMARVDGWNQFSYATKAGLLKFDLDNVVREHLQATDDILTDLETVANIVSVMDAHDDRADKIDPRGDPNDQTREETPVSFPSPGQYIVMVVQGDPGLTVTKSLSQTFLRNLYATPTVWVPSYGPWFRSMSANAMQRRFFPKQLRGNLNFTNSVSLKLMTEIMAVVSETTDDFYTDARNLPDIHSAMCLSVGYYCQRTKSTTPIPKTFSEMFDLMPAALEFIMNDIKSLEPRGNYMITTGVDDGGRKSMAPLKQQAVYSPGFFANNKLYNLLIGAEALPTASSLSVPGRTDDRDIIYQLTMRLYGDNVPPFQSYQWNLRAGLGALESLILAYVLFETTSLGESATRRLHLDQILPQIPDIAQTRIRNPPLQLRRGEAFSFLWKNYVYPTLHTQPNTSVSSLFPGLVLTALEMYQRRESGYSTSALTINLTGHKFDTLFEIINQKYLFHDPTAMLQARIQLRMAFEEGLGDLLNKPSAVITAMEIMENQFLAGDDYDRLYFLTLGYLPSPIAPL
ncbi:ORF11 [callitrichine gammaherpesvirus 3]|uniref:ORF11 n=1 Tax=callitrichine gammaherpesvirus 3 TaxID=106331 RepID=Q993J9_9GAMA|nr:ORF11 [callitrichine gammaherpesvirus 3]AAK38219.1 ORF11 [callitrichine gammaherpesvirus 3]